MLLTEEIDQSPVEDPLQAVSFGLGMKDVILEACFVPAIDCRRNDVEVPAQNQRLLAVTLVF